MHCNTYIECNLFIPPTAFWKFCILKVLFLICFVFFFSDALKDVRLKLLSVLSGNVVNIQTGHWVGKQSGLGAGSDSFYEYLLKSYILFGEKEDLEMFIDAYQNIQNHLRRGYVTSYEFHFSKHINIRVRYDGLYVWSSSRKFLFSSSKKKTLFLW